MDKQRAPKQEANNSNSNSADSNARSADAERAARTDQPVPEPDTTEFEFDEVEPDLRAGRYYPDATHPVENGPAGNDAAEPATGQRAASVGPGNARILKDKEC